MNSSGKILILDAGSPYNQLMTRLIRHQGVYSELHSWQLTADDIRTMEPDGVIISGGSHFHDKEDFRCDPAIFDMNTPVLAIGSAMLQMAEHFGGQVGETANTDNNEADIDIKRQTSLFQKASDSETVQAASAGDITRLPDEFQVDAVKKDNTAAAISAQDQPLYGLAFYPETEATSYGGQLLHQFVYEVCQSQGDWTVQNFIDGEVKRIQEQVGNGQVLCALSGGVDSSVVAALLHEAIGEQLTCIFVDHGLLRKHEAEDVKKTFAEDFNTNLIAIDASERFLSKLEGVDDPEEKRKIIGNEFIYVFDEEADKLKDMDFLAQGTLYTDVLESGTKSSGTIKSHHNVGGLPEDMQFDLIEPLKTLFKDEVRQVGLQLGLPEVIVWRQPFPGPGLAIRVLGEVTKSKLEIVRESDAILREEIAAAGLDKDIWQYFAVLPNIRSVGIKDNVRTYDHTIGIRAVTSVDGSTSDWARIPWDVLDHISHRLVQDVEHVNRVVYDVTSKPPSTIEWE